MPQRQLTRFLGRLAEDVVGVDGLRVVRMRCVGRHMGKKNAQVVKHHGPGRVRTIGAEAETELCKDLFLLSAHNDDGPGRSAS